MTTAAVDTKVAVARLIEFLERQAKCVCRKLTCGGRTWNRKTSGMECVKQPADGDGGRPVGFGASLVCRS